MSGRRLRVPVVLTGLGLGLLLAGCATPPELVLTPDAAQADIERLEAQRAETPDDPATLRDLGTLYVLLKRLGDGRPLLLRAYEADPTDPKTLFYLGLASERTARFDQAIKLYETYPDVPESSPYRAAMQGRHELVLRSLVRQEARHTVDRCLREGRCDPGAQSTVAVLPLRYQGSDERFATLGLGIAELVSIDLAQVDALTLVERVRLQALLDEIERAQGPGFNPEIGPETGRLIGAGQLVGGGFIVQDERDLTVSLRLSSVDGTDRELETAPGALDRIYQLQKSIVFGVIDALDVELTPEEREAIQFVPTRNLQAFLAYSRGLDAERQGNYGQAATEYRQAGELDPGFQPAIRRAGEASALQKAQAEVLPAPVLSATQNLSTLRTASMASTGAVDAPDPTRDGDGEWSTVDDNFGAAPLPLPPEPTRP